MAMSKVNMMIQPILRVSFLEMASCTFCYTRFSFKFDEPYREMTSIGLCFLLEEASEAAAETDCEDSDLLFRLVELDALSGVLLAE